MDNLKHTYIQGFSKLSKKQKVDWLSSQINISSDEILKYSLPENEIVEIVDSLSENTVAHYSLPFGLAPNFLINGENFILPLVTEESSVVAALARAAKIWHSRGGFNTRVIDTVKKGQVHFFWNGEFKALNARFSELQSVLIAKTAIWFEIWKKGEVELPILACMIKLMFYPIIFSLMFRLKPAMPWDPILLIRCLKK